jgi:penicillin amidase
MQPGRSEQFLALFFAQGFVHAQDRLRQLELNRCTAQGCLGELFGQAALNIDRTTATFSFNRNSFPRGNPRQFLSASY